MNKRKIYFYTSLGVTLGVLVLLVSGSSILAIAWEGYESVPLGTPITWLGMISFPLTIYWGVKDLRKPTRILNKVLSGILTFIIVLGLLWVPISYLLAGNLSFSFSEKETFQGGQIAMKWFWALSYAIPIGTILTITIYWVSLVVRKKTTDANNDL